MKFRNYILDEKRRPLICEDIEKWGRFFMDADKRIVNVELTRPDETCVLAQSVVAPYQIVELPKTSLPFTHADTWATKTCS